MDATFVRYKPDINPDTLSRLKEFLEEYNRHLRVCVEYLWENPDMCFTCSSYPESDLMCDSQCIWSATTAQKYVEEQKKKINQGIKYVRRAILKGRTHAMQDQMEELQRLITTKPLNPGVLYPAKVHICDFMCFDSTPHVKLYTLKKEPIDLPFLPTPEYNPVLHKDSPRQIDFSMEGMKVWLVDVQDKWYY